MQLKNYIFTLAAAMFFFAGSQNNVKACNASFAAYDSLCTVYFNNTSTGGFGYQWYFGDNNTSTQQDPVHTYANSGWYNVCLIVLDSSNQPCDSVCQNIYVNCGNNSSCNASFAAYDSLCTVYFNNTSTGGFGYQWYFGDNNTSTQQDPVHTYANSGWYNVCLIVLDSSNQPCDSVCQNIYVNCGNNSSCNASFIAYDSLCTVYFNNTSTGGFGYQWYFGDNNTSTQQDPVHTYANSGWYNVCLIVLDSSNQPCDSVCQNIYVNCGNNSSCNASFAAYDSLCTVYFNNTSTGGFGYQWYFGDNNTSTQQDPVHTYANSGWYNVCLIVLDSSNQPCDSVCQNIYVNCGNNNSCNADFTFSKLGCKVFFNNASSGGAGYQWYFGDNSTSTQQNPTHQYAGSGWYNVCLIVLDSSNQPCDSICKWVRVNCNVTTNNNTNTQTTTMNTFNKNTGVNEESETAFELNAYPNPANGLLNVEVSTANEEMAEIRLVDITGRRVAESTQQQLVPGQNRLQLNTADVTEGLYLLQVGAGDNTHTEKIIIKH